MREPAHVPARGSGRGHGVAPVLTLAVGAAALALHALPGLGAWAELTRDGVFSGQWWRLFSGHLVHFGSEHLAYDVLALLVLGCVLERRARWLLGSVLLGSALTISVLVLLLAPEVERYRGLSGLDSALFAALAFQAWRDRAPVRELAADARRWLPGALFLAKVAYEALTGTTLFVSTSATFESLPLAHLVGAGTGWAIAWLAYSRLEPYFAQGLDPLPVFRGDLESGERHQGLVGRGSHGVVPCRESFGQGLQRCARFQALESGAGP